MPILDIQIENKIIGKDSPIFLIAEAGVNHNGDITIAKKLIDLAAKAKVDAIKFQTFITEQLILKTTPKLEYQKNSMHDTEDFYKMLKKYELSRKDFKSLRNYCSEKGLIFLSTPFDKNSVELLEDLGISAYKVGSGDMNNFSLLKLICSKNKPILLSTGMANLKEVKESVDFIRLNKIEKLILFQCTTNYPASYEEINLNVIDTYQKTFPNTIIGFSDHSLGIEASIGAAAKGVKAIEKHFTLDKNMTGPDHKASLNPKELVEWVESIRNLEKSLGSFEKVPTRSEMDISKIAKKSIISSIYIKTGEKLKEENITTKRPGTGIPANEYYNLIGKKVVRDIPKDTILRWEDIE
ncbi:MAG: N-acetylneuraminate synthase [Candidatus Thorarchaeota archaeon]